MVRVMLPQHLRTLAHAGPEVKIEVQPPVTQRSVLDALEANYPMLRGPFVIRSRGSAGHFCASSPAKKIGPMSRQTHRCPKPSRPVLSRF